MTNTASNQPGQPKMKAKERRALDRARNARRGHNKWSPPPANPPTMKKT